MAGGIKDEARGGGNGQGGKSCVHLIFSAQASPAPPQL